MRTRKQQEVLAAGDILISQQRRNGWQERGLAHKSFIHPAAPRGATKLFCPHRKGAGPPLSHQGGGA